MKEQIGYMEACAVAIEEHIAAQDKERLLWLQNKGLTGEYTQELARQVEARQRLGAAMKEAEFKAEELFREARQELAAMEADMRNLKLARMRFLQDLDSLLARTRRFLTEEAPEVFPPAEVTRRLDDLHLEDWPTAHPTAAAPGPMVPIAPPTAPPSIPSAQEVLDIQPVARTSHP